MANPNLTTLTAAVAKILGEAQLTTGNTDLTVGTGKAWKVESATICNDTASAVQVTISVLASSGGTARKVVSGYNLAAKSTGLDTGANSADLREFLPRMLPEGAIIRATASAGTAVDLVVTGTELG